MVVSTKILSLCTGLGGLDFGIEIVVPESRVVCVVERDAYCAAVLAQGMEQGRISPAPIWDDLRTFDGRRWRGAVDCVTAGYPCQPFSVAGQKRGADDPRHLWPEVARIIDECAAPLVFLENVARHLTAGFDVVARDLHGMGYTVAALVCRAATVGAPHQRERLFALAVSDAGRELCRQLPEWDQGGPAEREHAEPRDMGATMADSDSDRPQGERQAQCRYDWGHASGHELDRCGGAGMADSHGGARQSGLCEPVGSAQGRVAANRAGEALGHPDGAGRQGGSRQHVLRGEPAAGCTDIWPPGPDELERWATVPVELWPSVESPLRGMVDGISGGLGFRREQLHALGNAVVPIQAAYAFATLAGELG